MQLNFHKSFWEASCTDIGQLEGLLSQLVEEGYQGSELFLPFYEIDAELTVTAHRQEGLNIIAGIATQGENVTEHITSLEQQVEQAMAFQPEFINSHTGRDIFSFKDNVTLFEKALALEHEHNITITHETHRTRPTFSTMETEKLVSELPELKLNLDISHWMVVHESDLSDQTQRIEALLSQVHHIHARVGYEEGPQVIAPQNNLWSSHVKNHTQWWQKVIDCAQQRGLNEFTITPEFGPFPYAQVNPDTGETLTDIWQTNGFIKQHLQHNLKIK